MKHRDTTESVLIHKGIYSRTIYEMEVWSLLNDYELEDTVYQKQIDETGKMDCGLRYESTGLFTTRQDALDHLEMMLDDSYAVDREINHVFIREKALHCMMQPCHYLKEWTYRHFIQEDESIVRNYDEDDNPFHGRPKEMIRFKRGDIVMVPDECRGYWGIVCATPRTTEDVDGLYERVIDSTDKAGERRALLDWSHDSYVVRFNDKDNGYALVAAHRLLPALHVPEFVSHLLST